MVIVSQQLGLRLVSPLTGVVGPLPHGRFTACKWGLLLTTCMSGDDPPSLQVLPPLLVVAVFVCLILF